MRTRNIKDRIYHPYYIPLCFILGLLMLLATSCKKYLEKKSDASMVVPETITDLQGLLDDVDLINKGTSNYVEASADDYFVTDEIFQSLYIDDRNAYTWNPFDYLMPNDWSKAYLPVYSSNVCLERLDKIPRTDQNIEQWDNVKGSALFFRAYYFLNLAWAFSKAYDETTAQSDLGIVLRMNSDFNIPSVRASVKESYERIIKDAKESVSYLPDHPIHVYRPSKAAAYGLLARTYLSMRQYDSAGKYAGLSLSIKSDILDYNSEIDAGSSNPFQPFNKETVFYSEISGDFLYLNYYYTPAFVDTTLYNSYNNNDIRKEAFFFNAGDYYSYKGMYTGSYTFFSGIATDELYLIRAECYARTGDMNAALDDLNTLLSKRFSPPFAPVTATSSQAAIEIILKERRKELLMRGLRWMDIKRLNKEGVNIIPKRLIAGKEHILPPNDNRYALPLPKDIIETTGIPQN